MSDEQKVFIRAPWHPAWVAMPMHAETLEKNLVHWTTNWEDGNGNLDPIQPEGRIATRQELIAAGEQVAPEII